MKKQKKPSKLVPDPRRIRRFAIPVAGDADPRTAKLLK